MPRRNIASLVLEALADGEDYPPAIAERVRAPRGTVKAILEQFAKSGLVVPQTGIHWRITDVGRQQLAASTATDRPE